MAQPTKGVLKDPSNCRHSYRMTTLYHNDKKFPGLQCRFCNDLLERREVVARYAEGKPNG